MDKEPYIISEQQTLPGSYEIPPPSYDEQSTPVTQIRTPPPKYGPTAPSSFGQPSQQVIVHHASPLILGPEPATVICPSCHAKVTTTLEIESSTRTHLIALLLFLAFFPLTCVPYLIDSCKNKNHYCPNCAAYLGRYQH